MTKEDVLKIVIITVISVITTRVYLYYTRPKVDLPEEYELITPNTPIEGEYKDGVLVIKFKH